MTVTIDLRPEIEAGLTSLAAEQGSSLAQYVRRVLEGQLAGHGQTMLSPGERAAVWRESVRGLPRTPPLSDEAISRESNLRSKPRGGRRNGIRYGFRKSSHCPP
jgi:hypothetical protein